ncbi:MAG TPA: hypothetical protein VKP30_07880, partial [Polyangiaceae bacterium]|nr:hypothetical protein [Polyangiaceae bacterium]
SKLFGRGKKARGAADDPDASIAELEAMLGEVPVSRKGRNSTKADPRADELRALVDEALADTGSQIR